MRLRAAENQDALRVRLSAPSGCVLSAIVRRLWRVNGAQPLIRLLATRAGVMAGLPSRARQFGAGLDCFSRLVLVDAVARVRRRTFAPMFRNEPEIVPAFAKKLIPDEAFVPSILASSGRFALAAADPALHRVAGRTRRQPGGVTRTRLRCDRRIGKIVRAQVRCGRRRPYSRPSRPLRRTPLARFRFRPAGKSIPLGIGALAVILRRRPRPAHVGRRSGA